jgi:DNA (cytosine-5)-methyltransferase 1
MNDNSLKRLGAIPKDGGSWVDLLKVEGGEELLIPSMKRYVAAEDFGSHPDVYGRAAWDKPCVTIKRECSHIGNGRYSHPDQDRLMTVREMAILNGFPRDVEFVGQMSNMYRHIGDAVPPLISYQLAHLTAWILSGVKPRITNLILPGTHLTEEAIVPLEEPQQLELALA